MRERKKGKKGEREKERERERERERESETDRQRDITMMYKSNVILFHPIIKTNEGYCSAV